MGHLRLAVFLESVTFSKGPASREALWGTRADIPTPRWEGGMGTGSGAGLGLALEGRGLLRGAGDLSRLHGCAFRAGVRAQHPPRGALWYTDLRARHLRIRPALLPLPQCRSGWGWGLGLVVS